MEFNESEYIDLTGTPTTFIYFLIYQKNVVYVGQTTRGLARVYSHVSNKHFDKIYVIECNEDELDYWEDFYIFKYRPVYNKQPNLKCNFSLPRLVHKINRLFNSKIRKPQVKKMLQELNIKQREYDGEFYISLEDYYRVIDCIIDYKKGAPLSEVFNIGI